MIFTPPVPGTTGKKSNLKSQISNRTLYIAHCTSHISNLISYPCHHPVHGVDNYGIALQRHDVIDQT